MSNFMTLCRRTNLSELLTKVSAYSIHDKPAVNTGADGLSLVFKRWATKKTAGSTKNGRDSLPKNLGVKKFGGEVESDIWEHYRPSARDPFSSRKLCVGMGKDHTLFALKEGHLKFEKHKLSGRKWVHIEPLDGHVLHPVYMKEAVETLSTSSA